MVGVRVRVIVVDGVIVAGIDAVLLCVAVAVADVVDVATAKVRFRRGRTGRDRIRRGAGRLGQARRALLPIRLALLTRVKESVHAVRNMYGVISRSLHQLHEHTQKAGQRIVVAPSSAIAVRANIEESTSAETRTRFIFASAARGVPRRDSRECSAVSNTRARRLFCLRVQRASLSKLVIGRDALIPINALEADGRALCSLSECVDRRTERWKKCNQNGVHAIG